MQGKAEPIHILSCIFSMIWSTAEVKDLNTLRHVRAYPSEEQQQDGDWEQNWN